VYASHYITSKQEMKEPETAERILIAGKANGDRCDNKVKSARYTLVTFFPKAR
jgi:hypothetical protein